MENTEKKLNLLHDIYTLIEKYGSLYANEETTYQLNDIGLRDLEARGYIKVLGREDNLIYDKEEELKIIVTEKGRNLLEENGRIKK